MYRFVYDPCFFETVKNPTSIFLRALSFQFFAKRVFFVEDARPYSFSVVSSFFFLHTDNVFARWLRTAIFVWGVSRGVSFVAQVVDNIIASPADVKFRELRSNNKTIQRAILGCQGGREFLHLLGFEK